MPSSAAPVAAAIFSRAIGVTARRPHARVSRGTPAVRAATRAILFHRRVASTVPAGGHGHALARVAEGEPVNGIVELAGPEPIRMDELARRLLSAKHDARQVTADVHARYFGAEVNDQSLTPGDNPRIGPTRFAEWLSKSAA